MMHEWLTLWWWCSCCRPEFFMCSETEENCTNENDSRAVCLLKEAST